LAELFNKTRTEAQNLQTIRWVNKEFEFLEDARSQRERWETVRYEFRDTT